MKKITILFFIFFSTNSCSVLQKNKTICLNVVGFPSEILVEKIKLNRKTKNNQIKGIVLNKEDSIPLENVKIKISDYKNTVKLFETDSVGKFEFNIEDGEYSMTFEKQFFRPIQDSLYIDFKNRVVIKVFLCKQDLDIFYQTKSPRLLKQSIKLQNQKRKEEYFGT